MNKSICIALVLFAATVSFLVACKNESWTDSEQQLIAQPGNVMRVLTINDKDDSLLLRSKCNDLTTDDIRSKTYKQLVEKMLATVTSPEQDGVGIAGPQVGVLRRVVAVQRFDKEGEPFEVYPNIRISAVRGQKEEGEEGCLSIPNRSGMVPRFQDLDIIYTSPYSLRDTVETVNGFTAVIFQHETDHLDGVLYIDYLK